MNSQVKSDTLFTIKVPGRLSARSLNMERADSNQFQHMCAGDNPESAKRVGRILGIRDVAAGLSPEQKLQRIKAARQSAGESNQHRSGVIMVSLLFFIVRAAGLCGHIEILSPELKLQRIKTARQSASESSQHRSGMLVVCPLIYHS